ncbi:MAG: GNAT family N-acetyltransferase [Bryobacteraceae bacterium]
MALADLRTTRLRLRPWTSDDVDGLHALWTAPEVRRFLWDNVVISRETAEQVVNSSLATADRHGIGCWALQVIRPESSVPEPVAGFCGFRFIDDGPQIELLHGLRGAWWGKGLATEASRAAIECLWRCTSFEKVYARTDPPNGKSVEVIQRLGMTLESTTDTMITYSLARPG